MSILGSSPTTAAVALVAGVVLAPPIAPISASPPTDLAQVVSASSPRFPLSVAAVRSKKAPRAKEKAKRAKPSPLRPLGLISAGDKQVNSGSLTSSTSSKSFRVTVASGSVASVTSFTGTCTSLKVELTQSAGTTAALGPSGLKVIKDVNVGTLTVRLSKLSAQQTCTARWAVASTFTPAAALYFMPTPTPFTSAAPLSTSSLSTPPQTGPVPTQASSQTPLWSAGYESGTLNEFAYSPWNSVPVAPSVTTSAHKGAYAGSYTIPGAGARSENIPNITLQFNEGDDRWITYATKLGSTVPLATKNWQVVGQIKNDGYGSPPLELAIDNGQFIFGGGWGWPGTDNPTTPKMSTRNVGAAVANTWDTWLIHVHFSSDPNVGTVDLWRNGNQLINGWKPIGGTLYPDHFSYLKLGYYRSTAITTAGTVYVDDAKVGLTRASVGG